MHVTYSFCGRSVPQEVIERSLELFDEQIGLDKAIAEVEERRQTERAERREQARHGLLKWQPGQPFLSDELIKDRRSEGLMRVIERIAIYAPEDRELINALFADLGTGRDFV